MRIQCPKCRQRFNTTPDFMGETVECGSCEYHFEISDQIVISENNKNYPKERFDSSYSEFKNVADPIPMPQGFSQAHYSEDLNVAQLEPLRPKQVLAILFGSCIFILVAASFLLAGREGGSMSGIGTLNRYILVGFSAFIAGGLLIYGMRKNRKLGVIFALVMGGCLISLPYFLPGGSVVGSSKDFSGQEVLIEGEGSIVKDADDIQREYLREIGYSPIASALEEHPESEVVGVFLRGGGELLGGKVAKSLYEATDKLDRGILFKRDESNLLLLTKQKRSIQELAVICEGFGEIKQVSEELRLIDLIVDEDLVTSSSTVAFDSSNLNFFRDNLTALQSINRIERLGAVRRLGGAEPLSYRVDVVNELLKLLPDSDTEMQLAIIKTLSTWSKPGEGAEPAVLSAAQSIHEEGELDSTTVEFLLERDVDGSELLLMDLWKKDPVIWSEIFITLGEEAEGLLLPKISKMDEIQFSSACRILQKVGTATALPTLTSLLNTKDGQNEKTLKATIDEIKKRL